MAQKAISVQVAAAFIARAKSMEMGRGVKRDRAALEFVCGAATALRAAAEASEGVASINAGESYKAVEMVAAMVAVRGYSFLVEIEAGAR